MHVTLICVGSLKEKYLKEGCLEYTKRLSSVADVSIVELKEERITDEDDRSKISKALEAEGDKILSAIQAGSYTIAMCIEGKEYGSVQLAEMIKENTAAGGRLAVIIGSSHGLCDRVKRSADLRLSISPLTFPHQLARLVTLEAIYRCLSIIAGKRYHK